MTGTCIPKKKNPLGRGPFFQIQSNLNIAFLKNHFGEWFFALSSLPGCPPSVLDGGLQSGALPGGPQKDLPGGQPKALPGGLQGSLPGGLQC